MKEVASILHISPRTAESHKYEIMQTLGVDTTAALIQYAVSHAINRGKGATKQMIYNCAMWMRTEDNKPAPSWK